MSSYQAPHPRPSNPTSHDATVRTTTLRLSLAIQRELEPLTTDHRTRVLLLIHAQIGDLLEALETITDD